MPNIFVKLLEKLFSPLSLAILSLLLIALAPRARERRVRILASAGMLAIVPLSIPAISDQLLNSLESFAPRTPLEELATADEIVVLGGTVAAYTDAEFPPEETSGSRIYTAARLYQLKKASRVLVSSGIGYHRPDGTWRTEAEDMRDILLTYGVPGEAIDLEPKALNTRENAEYSRAVLSKAGANTILVVTTAYHLKRATELFRKQGFSVTPVGAGRLVRPGEPTPLRFVPSVYSLSRSTSALKELLGARLNTIY